MFNELKKNVFLLIIDMKGFSRMFKQQQAVFISRPRVLSDLMIYSTQNKEKPFTVVKRIFLNQMDFENLTSDLLVERDYIDYYADLCKDQKEGTDCLLITPWYDNTGLLIIPGDNGYIKQAAYFE